MSLFSKHIHRIAFLDPRFGGFGRVGNLDSEKTIFQIRTNYLSKIWKQIKKVFPNKCWRIVPTPFLHSLPLFSHLFLNLFVLQILS